jgi:hypothetical protein
LRRRAGLALRCDGDGREDPRNHAIDVLRVRPILLQRYRGQIERALANLDLYLSFSRAFAVRGLRVFAETMTAAWEDESRAVEGRPDAQDEFVALYTMHAAKGLEWPIVIPINTMTRIKSVSGPIVERSTGHFYCAVFGVKPTGYHVALAAESAELDRERVRLWYVAATRARELLLLPRLDVTAKGSVWNAILDLSLANLPAVNLSHFPSDVGIGADDKPNTQTRDTFAAEAAAIAARQQHISWRAPSREEGTRASAFPSEEPAILISEIDSTWLASEATPDIRVRRARPTLLFVGPHDCDDHGSRIRKHESVDGDDSLRLAISRIPEVCGTRDATILNEQLFQLLTLQSANQSSDKVEMFCQRILNSTIGCGIYGATYILDIL